MLGTWQPTGRRGRSRKLADRRAIRGRTAAWGPPGLDRPRHTAGGRPRSRPEAVSNTARHYVTDLRKHASRSAVAGPGHVTGVTRTCDRGRLPDRRDRAIVTLGRDRAPPASGSRGRVHRTPILSLDDGRVASLAAAGGPARRRPAVPQGRAPPEDRLVQAPRDDATGSPRWTPRQRRAGAITMSAGNAGQAYAWAGARRGVPVDRRDAGGARSARRSTPAAATAPRSSSTARTSARRSPRWSGSATSEGLTFVHPSTTRT